MNRYYLGTPLVDRNVLDEAAILNYRNTETSLFREENWRLDFAEKQFTRITTNGEIILVIYFNARWDDERLIEYHNAHYPKIGYCTQKTLGARSIQTIAINEHGKVWEIVHNHYDSNWLDTTEEKYDEYYNLFEYRNITCDDDGSYAAERIFAASNYRVYKENYRD